MDGPTAVTIRSARPADASAVAALLRQFGYPARADAVGATLSRAAADPESVVAIAELERDVVGVLAITAGPSLSLQGTVGRVGELIVRADVHGRGIGDRLLLYAKGVAAERGFTRLEIAVPDAAADEFLLQRGFSGADEHLYRWTQLESQHPRLPVRARDQGRRRLA